MVHLPNGVLHSRKKNLKFCRKIDGSRKHYFKWGNPDTERQLSHVYTHRWFLNIKQRKAAYKPQSQRT